MSETTKLTDKMEAFCNEYMIDLNATQAAIRAGYSEDTARQIGSENLSKPSISDRIAELMAKRSTRVEITADYVLSSLKLVADRCMQAEPVMVRGEDGMEESGEFKFEHAGANKSLELLGRHIELFTDTVKNTHSIDLSNLSDAELDALVSGTKVS